MPEADLTGWRIQVVAPVRHHLSAAGEFEFDFDLEDLVVIGDIPGGDKQLKLRPPFRVPNRLRVRATKKAFAAELVVDADVRVHEGGRSAIKDVRIRPVAVDHRATGVGLTASDIRAPIPSLVNVAIAIASWGTVPDEALALVESIGFDASHPTYPLLPVVEPAEFGKKGIVYKSIFALEITDPTAYFAPLPGILDRRAEDLVESPLGAVPPDMLAGAVSALVGRLEESRAIRHAVSRTTVRPAASGRRPLTDDHLRKVAAVYIAGSPYPKKAVEHAFGTPGFPVSTSTASDWIRKARERGFLPLTQPGKKTLGPRVGPPHDEVPGYDGVDTARPR